MNLASDRGFSLIELAIVVLVMGMLLSFMVPGFRRLSESYQLRGAAENVAGQFRLAREKAIGTGTSQTLLFTGLSSYGAQSGGTNVASWQLPRGVTFSWTAGTDSTYTLARDGRVDRSGTIILQDSRGNADTVSVQLSGLVLSQ